MNKEKINCNLCVNEATCNSAMDYPICLSQGECLYIGEREDDFNYSLFKPKFEAVQLFPRKIN